MSATALFLMRNMKILQKRMSWNYQKEVKNPPKIKALFASEAHENLAHRWIAKGFSMYKKANYDGIVLSKIDKEIHFLHLHFTFFHWKSCWNCIKFSCYRMTLLQTQLSLNWIPCESGDEQVVSSGTVKTYLR